MSSPGPGGTLYVAGSSSAVPRPGCANSGYVVRARGKDIAIDFGNGVFSSVRRLLRRVHLDAIFISHMHADHFFDLVPLRYALRYEFKPRAPLPVYLPPGGIKILNQIAHPLKETAHFYADTMDLREYDPAQEVRVGDVRVSFTPTVHYIPAFAMRLQVGGRALGYSADTAPCPKVTQLVREADLFLCESALGVRGQENGKRGHLNAREAAELAEQARVKHLVLTHYSAKADPEKLREAAEKYFSEKVTVADDGMEISF